MNIDILELMKAYAGYAVHRVTDGKGFLGCEEWLEKRGIKLSDLQPNSEPEPPLPQAAVSRSVYEIEYSSIGTDYTVKVEGSSINDALLNFHKAYRHVDAVHRISTVE